MQKFENLISFIIFSLIGFVYYFLVYKYISCYSNLRLFLYATFMPSGIIFNFNIIRSAIVFIKEWDSPQKIIRLPKLSEQDLDELLRRLTEK